LKPNTSLLYPLLKMLEREGLISLRKEVHGSRLKKVYTITEKGIEYLKTNNSVMDELRLFEKRMREMKELGIPELIVRLKNIYENLDKLGEKEKHILRDIIRSFHIQLKNVLSEVY